MPDQAYVYILASGFKHLYIGITSQLEPRIAQHQNGSFKNSFTDRYNIKHLVYFERFACITSAIAREKQLKRWSRIKKIRLIVAENPDWRDLSKDWGKPIPPYAEPNRSHSRLSQPERTSYLSHRHLDRSKAQWRDPCISRFNPATTQSRTNNRPPKVLCTPEM